MPTSPRLPLLLGLLLAATLPAAAASAQQGQPPPTISVTGQAEIRVVPDEAVFNLQVERVDKELAAAQRQTDESVRQILAIARRFDIPPSNVKTDYFSVEMRYNTDYIEDDEDPRRRQVKREFVGYAVSKSVILRATDLSRFEALFSEVLTAGVSKVSGVEFRTSKLRQHRDEARAQAVRAAREKAAAMARELGQNIGKALSVTEEGFAQRVNAANYTGVLAGSYSSADEDSSFAPGTISVTARVAVSFQLL